MSCRIDAQGVNEHNLTRGPVEFENYFSLQEGKKVDLENELLIPGEGFAVAVERTVAVVVFPHVVGLYRAFPH